MSISTRLARSKNCEPFAKIERRMIARFRRVKVSPTGIVVCLMLSTFARDGDPWRVGLERLSHELGGLSRRTLRRAIEELERKGLLARSRRHKREAYAYRILLEPVATVAIGDRSVLEGDSAVLKGDRSVPFECADLRPQEISTENKKENTTTERAVSVIHTIGEHRTSNESSRAVVVVDKAVSSVGDSHRSDGQPTARIGLSQTVALLNRLGIVGRHVAKLLEPYRDLDDAITSKAIYGVIGAGVTSFTGDDHTSGDPRLSNDIDSGRPKLNNEIASGRNPQGLAVETIRSNSEAIMRLYRKIESDTEAWIVAGCQSVDEKSAVEARRAQEATKAQRAIDDERRAQEATAEAQRLAVRDREARDLAEAQRAREQARQEFIDGMTDDERDELVWQRVAKLTALQEAKFSKEQRVKNWRDGASDPAYRKHEHLRKVVEKVFAQFDHELSALLAVPLESCPVWAQLVSTAMGVQDRESEWRNAVGF